MALKQENGTVVRVTTFSADRPWRKHGNYRHEHDERGTGWLDAIAHRKVAPMGAHGLVIRKGGTK